MRGSSGASACAKELLKEQITYNYYYNALDVYGRAVSNHHRQLRGQVPPPPNNYK